MPQPITRNALFYGDNLDILREYVADNSVDLVYLDPPFNSARNYNVLFRDEAGKYSEAQIEAFEDTWHWTHETERTYRELVTESSTRVAELMAALRSLVGTSEMGAYLVMMAARLVELHRVLKPTGSLYLHADPTASHYLKIVLDSIFDPRNFRSEITWRRTATHNDAKRWPDISDVILFYSNGPGFTWNPQYTQQSAEDVAKRYRFVDENGRRFSLGPMDSPNPRPNLMYGWKGYPPPEKGWRYSKETMAELDAAGEIWYPPDNSKRLRRKLYLDESRGALVGNVWTDIVPLQGSSGERLGYPTQKPLILLERIISASSNPGDIVLDPFCGCGTALVAAQKLGRRWIGIDITHLSIALMKYRLCQAFPDVQFDILGEPKDLASARQLAQDDRFQFQWWALSLVKARPLGGESGSKTGKKGADRGIDGVISFFDDASNKPKRVIVQVKSGHVQRGDIGQLVGTVQREDAAIGVFVTLEEPTREMVRETVVAGQYHSPGWQQEYPRIQILTIEQLLHGAEIKMPPPHGTFRQAQRVRVPDAEQVQFDLGAS